MPNDEIQKIRILVVEDDELQIQILEAVLIAAGFDVDIVTSGLDAVRLVQPARYDVVLVDYQVPEINGVTITKLIDRFLGSTVRPVLIALTATPEHPDIVTSKATGAFDAVVSKSSDFSVLLSVIKGCVASAPDSASKQSAVDSLLYKEWQEYDMETPRPGMQGANPGAPRILVVEDDESQRELLTAVLERQGYIVEPISGGLEALNQIREGCFDLALVDYNLPEMDGLALATLVLDLMQEHVRPRLIALTSTPAGLHDKEVTAGSVFDEVLGKSSNFDELIRAVDQHLRSSPNPETRLAATLAVPADFPTRP